MTQFPVIHKSVGYAVISSARGLMQVLSDKKADSDGESVEHSNQLIEAIQTSVGWIELKEK